MNLESEYEPAKNLGLQDSIEYYCKKMRGDRGLDLYDCYFLSKEQGMIKDFDAKNIPLYIKESVPEYPIDKENGRIWSLGTLVLTHIYSKSKDSKLLVIGNPEILFPIRLNLNFYLDKNEERLNGWRGYEVIHVQGNAIKNDTFSIYQIRGKNSIISKGVSFFF